MEKPISNEKRAEISKKIENLSKAFESSTSLSNLLTKYYKKADERVKNLESQLLKLNQEKSDLEDKLNQKSQEFAKEPAVVEAEKQEIAAREEHIIKLTEELENLKQQSDNIVNEEQSAKEELEQSKIDNNEKVQILNTFRNNFTSLMEILQKLDIPADKFKKLINERKIDFKKNMLDSAGELSEHNQNLISELAEMFDKVQADYLVHQQESQEELATEDPSNEKSIIEDIDTTPEPEEDYFSLDLTTDKKEKAAVINETVADKEKNKQDSISSKDESYRTSDDQLTIDGGFRDKVYTLIEKIENSRVDIHSHTYNTPPPASTPLPVAKPLQTAPPYQPTEYPGKPAPAKDDTIELINEVAGLTGKLPDYCEPQKSNLIDEAAGASDSKFLANKKLKNNLVTKIISLADEILEKVDEDSLEQFIEFEKAAAKLKKKNKSDQNLFKKIKEKIAVLPDKFDPEKKEFLVKLQELLSLSTEEYNNQKDDRLSELEGITNELLTKADVDKEDLSQILNELKDELSYNFTEEKQLIEDLQNTVDSQTLGTFNDELPKIIDELKSISKSILDRSEQPTKSESVEPLSYPQTPISPIPIQIPIQSVPVQMPVMGQAQYMPDMGSLASSMDRLSQTMADKGESESQKEEKELTEAAPEEHEKTEETIDEEITAAAEETEKAADFNPYRKYDEFDDNWGYEAKTEQKTEETVQEKPAQKKSAIPPYTTGESVQQQAPRAERDKLDIRLRDDDYEVYGTKLILTYLFDSMPENLSYSKYKPMLRNACRITLLGNLQEGLDMFNMLKEQTLPTEYKEMIDKNLRDVKYFLRGKFRSSEAGQGIVE